MVNSALAAMVTDLSCDVTTNHEHQKFKIT